MPWDALWRRDGSLGLSRFVCVHVHDERITGPDRFTPFHAFCCHEVSQLTPVFSLFQHENSGDLGDGFQLQYAWHDGMIREMPLKVRLVDADVLEASDLVALDLQ